MAGIPWTADECTFLLDHPDADAGWLAQELSASGVKRTKNACWLKRAALLHEAGLHQKPDAARALERLGTIADLLERSGVDPEAIGKVERIRLNQYQGMYKDETGEAQVVDMQAASVVLSPTWDEGPAWPLVEPGPPVAITCTTRRSTPAHDGMETAVILPDAQIGYYRDARGQLHPTHDEAALDIALQIVAAAAPDRVVLLGDTLDFPELSTYRLQPAFVQTTQPTINRGTLWLAAIRAACAPGARIDWLEANHCIRIQNYIKDNAAAAFGLKRGNMPESWPVLSVPTLCRFEDSAVTYVPGYPANHVWLSDRLKVIHGHRAQKGSNAYPYLKEERVSTIYGHTHRREWAECTRQSRYGPRTIMAANPGCLCRIDGAVPGTKGGTDLDGVPITSWEDWQQGVAVVHYTPGDGPFFLEMVPIHHGLALWHGQMFRAACDVEGNAVEDAA